MQPLSRRAFLRLGCVAVPAGATAQRRRMTKDELQQELASLIAGAVRDAHVQIAADGAATVKNWAGRGAARLVNDQSEASITLAATNAEKCGRAIGAAAAATSDRRATRELILGVFQKLCPIYPFC